MSHDIIVKIEADEKMSQADEDVASTGSELIFDVMEHIVKFVNMSNLKDLRVLDKTWTTAATRELKRRTVIFLKTGQKGSRKLKLFEEETKNLQPIKKIRIFMTSKTSPHHSFENERNCACSREMEAFNDILEFVSNSLQTLEITRTSFFGTMPPFFALRETIQFPALVKLEILNYDWGFQFKNEERSCKALFSNAPNIQQLVIANFDESFLKPLLNEDGSRNWNMAPKLNGLTFIWIDDYEGIDYLARFPQTFEKLNLNCYSVTGENFRDFENLLDKNKGMLTHLNLHSFTGISRAPWPLPWRQEFRFTFPDCFGKLQTLQLMFYDLKFDIGFGKWRKLYYSNVFPSLKKLSLQIVECGPESDLERFWKTFFPKQICKSVIFLELNFRELGPYWELHHSRMENLNWTSQMFPNAKVQIIGRV